VSILTIHTLTLHLSVIDSILRGHLAYLDPGTGSYLIQLLIAGLLGLLFVVRLYWNKIVAFFRKVFKREEPVQTDDDSQKPA
jgi:hypothetical protein